MDLFNLEFTFAIIMYLSFIGLILGTYFTAYLPFLRNLMLIYKNHFLFCVGQKLKLSDINSFSSNI